MMQRIYNDGKDGLDAGLPEAWAKPVKMLNYRCPKRIVRLINAVRLTTDGQQQTPRSGAIEGVVRLFVLPSNQANKPDAERPIRQHMAQQTGDLAWGDQVAVKTLVLEHRMAATRLGFLDAFGPLYDFDSWRTGLLDGKLALVNFFSASVVSLVDARRSGDRFAVARILKAGSPLLTSEAIRNAPDKEMHLKSIDTAVDAVVQLWEQGADPSLQQVLQRVADYNLLDIPDILREHATGGAVDDDGSDEVLSERDEAVRGFLAAPFSQVRTMAQYLHGHAPFDTHQGVKGLEFDRVMVVMDDSEAKGFLFKYEQLFGGGSDMASKSAQGTKRLFYVTASRAKQSLALVAYTTDPLRVKEFVLAEGWFDNSEIVMGIPP